MTEVLKNFNAKKAKQENNIPIKFIKENMELFSTCTLRWYPAIIAAIEKWKPHPSILKIRKRIRAENYFDFKHIDDKKNDRSTKKF